MKGGVWTRCPTANGKDETRLQQTQEVAGTPQVPLLLSAREPAPCFPALHLLADITLFRPPDAVAVYPLLPNPS